jgi:protocatechuate 3,4-dioxygenase beta subunit
MAVAMAVVAAVAIFLAQMNGRHRGERALEPRPTEPTVTKKQSPTPIPEAAPSARTETRSLAIATVVAEAAAKSIPVWGAEIDQIEPGSHRYWLYLDGRQIADPVNPVAGENSREARFQWPPSPRGNSTASTATIPRVLESDRAIFIYEGPIERSLLFIAPFRGEWWGIDEFRPLNAAARKNLERIRADRSLLAVEGLVMDPNRRPIPGARVRFLVPYVPNTAPQQHIQTVACNEQGRFQIERVHTARPEASARAVGFVENSIPPFDAPSSAVVIVLNPTAVVVGSVRNETGQLVANARVTAQPASGGSYDRPRDQTQTNALGRFAFGSLKPATYSISAEADGYVPARKGGVVVLPGGKGQVPHVELVIAKGLSVKGRVIQRTKDGGEGPGIEGADVYATIWFPQTARITPSEGSGGGGMSVSRTVRTSAKGEFAVDGLIGKANLRVYAQHGRMRSEKDMSVVIEEGKPPSEIKLYLPAAGKVAGRVVDVEKEPIAGATVQLVHVAGAPQRPSSGMSFRDTYPEFVADAAGRFVIDGVEANAHCYVVATAPGYAPAIATDLLVDSPVEAEIVLKRGASLEGRVVEAASERLLPGMTVLVGSENRTTSFFARTGKDLRTGEDGAFRMTDLEAGMYGFGARGKIGNTSYMSGRTVTVRVGEGEAAKDVVIRVEAAATIKGVVLSRDSRKPLADVEVGFRREDADSRRFSWYTGTEGSTGKTGTDGTFTFSGVPPGEVVVSARKDLYLSVDKKVQVKAGETLEGVELLMREPSKVSGIVLDVDGGPVPDIPLILHIGYPIGTGKSGADGRFAIEAGQVPGYVDIGSQKMRVLARPTGKDERYGASEPFRVRADEPTSNIIVQLQKGGRITGTVRDQSGEPLARASASAHGDTKIPVELYAASDESGRYEILRVPPGEYKVGSGKEGYKSGEVSGVKVEGGLETSGIDIVLEKEEKKEDEKITLKGLLLDIHQKPLGGWAVSVTSKDGREVGRGATGHDGTFVLAGLPPGKLRFGFSRPDYRSPMSFAAQGVEVKADLKSEALFVLPLGATMKGRLVVEGSRQPLSNAKIALRLNDVDPRQPYYNQGQLNERPIPARVPEGQPWPTFFRMDHQVAARDNGSFTLDALPIDTLAVSIESTMTLPREIKNLTPDKNYAIDLGDVLLSAGKAIRMQLIDGRTGRPFKPPRRMMPGGYESDGILVTLMLARPSQGMPHTWEGRQCVPDEKGVIVITPVDDTVTTITIQTPEFMPLRMGPIRLDAAAETDLGPFVLNPGRTVTGRLIDAVMKQPIRESSGRHVTLAGKNAQGRDLETLSPYSGERSMELGDDGRFTIRRVPPDLYSLHFDCGGGGVSYLPRVIAPVTLAAAGNTDLGDVALERGYTLRGRLLGPNGEQAHYGDVSAQAFVASREGGREVRREFYRHVNVGEDGEFELNGLPAGSLKLTVYGVKHTGNNWMGPKGWCRFDTVVTLDPNKKDPVEVRFPANAGQ